ncbi:YolD-like family protein [Salinibacillus xinjiangensis]|nr:YolD-like family protein [Salinibacillus xinjiangensis]
MLRDRGNIKWTSLMLPEHVEELKKLWSENEKEPMPILDEQELMELNQKCKIAYDQQQTVLITVHEDGVRKTLEGTIKKMDQHQQLIHLTTSEGIHKIPYQRLIYIEI